MQYINDLKDGDTVSSIYLCRKRQGMTAKNGRAYDNVTFQDKTGSIDGKIWEPDNPGIEDFAEMDYVEVAGEITTYQKKLQFNVRRARRVPESQVNPAEYVPTTTKDIKKMFGELMQIAASVRNPYLRQLLIRFFVDDPAFVEKFKTSSAAKTVHHGYLGGLLEHTLGVTKLCDYIAGYYTFINRDLLITAAMLHDVGKTRELSSFPKNDYTEEGQMIGHIIIGVEMIDEKLKEIKGFPPQLATELRHCILAHHGELEYGSPKKPAIVEAAALNMADNTDAKLEIFRETLNTRSESPWLGFVSFLDSNIRRTE